MKLGNEEFYELMKKKTHEIECLDVPEEIKKELYSGVERTIQRYERNKEIRAETRRLITELKEELIKRENLC